MHLKLTKRTVDAAPPGKTVWDTEIRGFGLRVTPNGSKSFVLKYVADGRQRWLKIGRYGDLTPDEARLRAQKLRGEIAGGADPAGERIDRLNEPTFADFAIRYLIRYSRHHKKPNTIKEEISALRNHILPAIGPLKVRDISRGHIEALHKSIAFKPRGGKYAANRAAAQLRHMLNYAEDDDLRPRNSNPVTRLKMFKEKARERFLSARELHRLGRALAVADRAGKAPYAVAAIRLLIFTGARLNEILTLKWDYVDQEARLLRLPDSKTGAKTIALAPAALTVLRSLPRQAGNPYVICGANEGARLINLQKPWRRIRKAALIDDVRIHDLRHSFASVAVANGMSLPIIGSMLGHTQQQTTQRYAHVADDPRLAAADAVASTIAAQMSGQTCEVVPLRKRYV